MRRKKLTDKKVMLIFTDKRSRRKELLALQEMHYIALL